MGGRDDLSWEVEPFSEVVKALWGEGVVVVLPGELGLEVASGGEGLSCLYDLKGDVSERPDGEGKALT